VPDLQAVRTGSRSVDERPEFVSHMKGIYRFWDVVFVSSFSFVVLLYFRMRSTPFTGCFFATSSLPNHLRRSSAFALPLCMLLNRSLATCIFPDRRKISFVTPIFKSSRRNDISYYRRIAILSAITKLFELLVYEETAARRLSTRFCKK
jgi:hypothetical protein